MTEEIPIIVNVRFEWDTEKHEFKLSPKTSIDKLIRRFEKNQKMSGIAFFYGDVELNGTNTFAECNIPEGAILTVRGPKRKREDCACARGSCIVGEAGDAAASAAPGGD